MAKKYTSKQVSEIMRFVLIGAFEHMEAIKQEIRKIGPVDEKTDPLVLSRAKVMHLTMTCINDIIHPAHKLCYSLFEKNNYEFFDLLVKNHSLAMEKKLVPDCYCLTCDPDHSRYEQKMTELKGNEHENGLVR